MDGDKLLTATVKCEARRAIDEYLKSEAHDVAYGMAKEFAAKWFKENSQAIQSTVNDELEKMYKKLTTGAVKSVVENLRYY